MLHVHGAPRRSTSSNEYAAGDRGDEDPIVHLDVLTKRH